MSAVPTASIDAAAQRLCTYLAPEAARGVRATNPSDPAAPGGGRLRVGIDDCALLTAQARAEVPQMVLRATAALCSAVPGGHENAELLSMAGRVEIDGALRLAAKPRLFIGRRI